MSTTPMTAAQWQSQLKKFGVPFVVLPTFKDPASGRDGETGLKFGPVFGCGIHHTGDDAPDINDRKVIVNGRSDLPGPLAHGGLRDDGVVELVTTGRANHFGGGDPDVLRAVKAENYGKFPPKTDKHQGESGAVDGNDSFYGLEVYYSGGHPMTKKQYASAVGWAAAICDFHDWSAKSTIGHKEWSEWKIDPGHVDMSVFRADVQNRMDSVNKKKPAAPAGPTSHKRPNVTASIAALVAYYKRLGKIEGSEKSVAALRARAKADLKVLRDLERG